MRPTRAGGCPLPLPGHRPGSLQSAASAASSGGLDPLTGLDGGTLVDGGTMSDAALLGFAAAVLGVALISVVVQFLLQTVGTGMLTHVMGRAVLGDRITMGRAWGLVRPQLWRLLGVTLLVGLLVVAALLLPALPGALLLVAEGTRGLGAFLLVLGVLAGIPLAAWVYVRLALAAPALVLENAGPVLALRRSARLVTGSWWRLFGILLLASIVAQIVAGVLGFPFSIAGTLAGGAFGDDALAGVTASLFLSSLGAVVSTSIVVPFTAGVTALLYIDRRMRREGLDLALQRTALGTGGTATGGPPAGGGAPSAPPQTW